jgi:hypothetical protein
MHYTVAQKSLACAKARQILRRFESKALSFEAWAWQLQPVGLGRPESESQG